MLTVKADSDFEFHISVSRKIFSKQTEVNFMFRKMYPHGLGAMILVTAFSVIPVPAVTSNSEVVTRSASVTQVRRYGPYATLRRANEVANYARRLGYNAKIFYGGSLYYGTREYYVDVWR